MWGAYEGHPDCVRTLLEKKADPCVVNRDGLTALQLAVERKKGACVSLLRQASFSRRDSSGGAGALGRNGGSISLDEELPQKAELATRSPEIVLASRNGPGPNLHKDASESPKGHDRTAETTAAPINGNKAKFSASAGSASVASQKSGNSGEKEEKLAVDESESGG